MHPRNFCVKIRGTKKKINRAVNIATTPPNLLGMERRMA